MKAKQKKSKIANILFVLSTVVISTMAGYGYLIAFDSLLGSLIFTSAATGMMVSVWIPYQQMRDGLSKKC